MKLTLQDALNKMPLIAVLRGVQPSEVIAIAAALVEAGFTCIEVPLNSPDAFASIEKLVKNFGDTVLTGAGTITRQDEIDKIVELGGNLLVMPHTDPALIRHAKSHANTFAIPGCFTPSEVFSAIHAGADALKLFPAEILTPRGVKAIKSILKQKIPLLTNGGITPDNMQEFVKAGTNGIGLGTALYAPGDSALEVANKARGFVETMRKLMG